jgi:small subunit ribosomal protein S1
MSIHQHDLPPSPDELYWESLLKEGEFSRTVKVETSQTPDEAPKSQATDTTGQASFLGDDDWQEARRLMDEDAVLTLVIIGFNRGGLLADWRSLRGFVPASQLTNVAISDNPNTRRDTLNHYIGKTLSLRIIELDPQKNRLIFSERAAQVGVGARADLLNSIEAGQIVKGRVTNLCDFGAFVDLGGVEGLIHISELSWGRVGHPSDLLKRHQDVDVFVLDVDPSLARVALSLKRLIPDPWETVAERYRVGEIIEGKITNVVDFGAFACVEEGLEGLIHFSELAEGHFLHPRNVVKEGETIRARILSIDGKARRLGLTLRLK